MNIEKEFNEFFSEVYAPNGPISSSQREDIRRCFYSGNVLMLSFINALIRDKHIVLDDFAQKQLGHVQEQLNDFQKELTDLMEMLKKFL